MFFSHFFTVLNLKSGNKLITHQVDTFMMLTISLVVKSIDFPKLFVSFEYNQIIHNKTWKLRLQYKYYSRIVECNDDHKATLSSSFQFSLQDQNQFCMESRLAPVLARPAASIYHLTIYNLQFQLWMADRVHTAWHWYCINTKYLEKGPTITLSFFWKCLLDTSSLSKRCAFITASMPKSRNSTICYISDIWL